MKNPVHLVAALAAGVSAQAQLVIDHFDAPGPAGTTVSQAVVGTSAVTSVSGLGPTVLQGTRNMSVTVAVGAGLTYAAANVTPDNYNLSVPIAVDAHGDVWWDGTPAGSGLNLDISGYSQFYFQGVGSDLGVTLTVTLFDGANTESHSLTRPATLPLTEDRYMSTSLFTTVDLTSIDRIGLQVDTPQAGDAIIHVFYLVPEPASAGAAVAGLCVAGMVLRRKAR
jgi:hypothetical protein